MGAAVGAFAFSSGVTLSSSAFCAASVTKKNNSNSYFAIALKKPENSITIKNIEPNKNSLIHLLGYDEPLIWSFDNEEGLKIQVPQSIPGEMAWTFQILGKEI